jgi:hypothetical protein
VAESGRVVSVRVVNGNPLLQNAAVSAVKHSGLTSRCC